MNSRMMISRVEGSSMPKFCWMKNGRKKIMQGLQQSYSVTENF